MDRRIERLLTAANEIAKAVDMGEVNQADVAMAAAGTVLALRVPIAELIPLMQEIRQEHARRKKGKAHA